MWDKRKVSYLRVSQEDAEVTSGAEEESLSIHSQRLSVKKYLEEHPELGKYSEFEEIVDDGYSGTNFRRPGMERLIKLVQAGSVDIIIVKDLSRFARNYLEAGHFLEYVFPAFQVRFISINDNYDSQELGESMAGFSLAIHNLVNQLYSKDISRKIKSVVDLKKMNGEYCFGAVPYGYRKGKKHNTIVIDPQAADIVKRIFDWAASGITVTQIAKQLNMEQVPTPSEYLKAVRGKYRTSRYWSFDSVKNILINRIYTGDTVPFKSHVRAIGSNRVKLLSEEEQIIIPDTHEAIISREVFYKARTVIRRYAKKGEPTHGSLLSPYVVCGCCGNKLHKGRASNRTFRCATARYAPTAQCAGVFIQEKALADVLLHALQRECAIADAKLSAVKAAQKATMSERMSVQKEIFAEKKALEKAKASALRLYEDYVSGELQRDDYLNAKAKAKESEEAAMLQINLLHRRLTAIDEEENAAEQMKAETTVLANRSEIQELTPELLKSLLKSVEVYPEGVIHIRWLFRDAIA